VACNNGFSERKNYGNDVCMNANLGEEDDKTNFIRVA